MRNVFVLREAIVADIVPRNDTSSLTSNPFSKDIYILFEDGTIIGVSESSHKVG